MDFHHPQVAALIELAINEDIGDGDHSSLASISGATQGESNIIFKENGVIAGLDLAAVILHRIDPKIHFLPLFQDGDLVSKGTIVAAAKGSVHGLLASERILLNFMQRLSAIATRTSEAVAKVKAYPVKILDTRKTTPGMRLLEKWAVKTGGGENHRMGLFDMVMLKDNHVDSSGGITAAVTRTREYLKTTGRNLRIEVETRNMAEVKEALDCNVDRIMLDNFNPEQCAEAVKFIARRAETEASGGIHAENLEVYAQSGVDFISLGYLTHSAKSLDISMKTHMVR